MARKRLSKVQLGILKTVVFAVCLLPISLIILDAVNNLLGADPIQTLHFRTGDWTIRFLLITLTMTPLQRMFGSSLPIRFRRMLGLFTFFYASMHLLVWLVLDQSLNIDNMLEDVPESPYIILGLLAYSMLLALAVTSTIGMMRRMGSSWFTLHKLIYLIAVMGVVHFFWLTKLDYSEPVIYAVLLVVLLAFRWNVIKEFFVAKVKVA
ncbi:MAG: sulfoxide reductase heme-binding subunit YedZ [Cycloclasticus sp. symbiont of Bathymodiolus heckerae]|nr:MAG: sulfoxide reductase heme-binding subunit YedZ [Cycloclasticus sp. symbiont of Bathymodiolus heckerae]